jgi:cell wall-associated NlpC family hydrolase
MHRHVFRNNAGNQLGMDRPGRSNLGTREDRNPAQREKVVFFSNLIDSPSGRE